MCICTSCAAVLFEKAVYLGNKISCRTSYLTSYLSVMRWCPKHFSGVYAYMLCTCLLCFCYVIARFLLLPVQVWRKQKLERAGHCACGQLTASRASEGGKETNDIWVPKQVGTLVNACLPAVLLNVSPLTSQITLNSFSPVFVFILVRLFAVICVVMSKTTISLPFIWFWFQRHS